MPHKDPAIKAKYQRDYHHRNAKIKNARRVRHHLIDRLGFLLLAGKDLRCNRCGFDDLPAALAFHHRDPNVKLFEIDQAIRRVRGQYAEEDIIAEIKKCDILCNNCHAIEHASYDKETVQSVISEIHEILSGNSCNIRDRWKNLASVSQGGD